MDPTLWLTFAATAFVIGAIPGPGVAAITGFAFSSGRRVALAAVAGMASGSALAMTVSLAGAGAILASSALAFSVLKWLGAAYLVAIGLIAVLRSGGAAEAVAERRPVTPRLAFWSTAAVGTFHPKTILFFVAFATQFIRPNAPYWPQAAILIATFTGVAAVTDTAYALLAARAASAVERPAVRRWAQRAGGGALIAAGVATAAMRRHGIDRSAPTVQPIRPDTERNRSWHPALSRVAFKAGRVPPRRGATSCATSSMPSSTGSEAS
jgi:threonine/homoserine/homoserine lactone efflux protein